MNLKQRPTNATRKEKEQAIQDNAKLDSSVGKLPMKFAKLGQLKTFNTSQNASHISPLDAKSEALNGEDQQIHEHHHHHHDNLQKSKKPQE